MIHSTLIFFSFIFFFVLQCFTMALSLEELKQEYANMVMECSNDYPITAGDIKQLQNKQMPDNLSIKCIFACAYKKSGMMNEKGELSIEGVNDISKKYLSNDPVKMKKSEEFTEACKGVNDVAVSDGENGCERAALIFKCSVEKAPEFDFA